MVRFQRFRQDPKQWGLETLQRTKKWLIGLTIFLLIIAGTLGTVFGFAVSDIHTIIGKGNTLEKQVKATKQRMLLGFGCSAGILLLLACGSGYAVSRVNQITKSVSQSGSS
jgi:hypothetical protein